MSQLVRLITLQVPYGTIKSSDSCPPEEEQSSVGLHRPFPSVWTSRVLLSSPEKHSGLFPKRNWNVPTGRVTSMLKGQGYLPRGFVPLPRGIHCRGGRGVQCLPSTLITIRRIDREYLLNDVRTVSVSDNPHSPRVSHNPTLVVSVKRPLRHCTPLQPSSVTGFRVAVPDRTTRARGNSPTHDSDESSWTGGGRRTEGQVSPPPLQTPPRPLPNGPQCVVHSHLGPGHPTWSEVRSQATRAGTVDPEVTGPPLIRRHRVGV